MRFRDSRLRRLRRAVTARGHYLVAPWLLVLPHIANRTSLSDEVC